MFHPGPEYVALAAKAAQMRLAAVMNAMDSILKAADPMTIAQRRVAMAQAAYQQKYGLPLQQAQAEYQMQLLPAQLAYYKKHGYFMPTTPQGVLSARQVEQQDRDAERQRGFSGQGGATARQGPYGPVTPEERAETPPYMRWPPPSQAEIQQWHRDNGTVEPSQIGAPEKATEPSVPPTTQTQGTTGLFWGEGESPAATPEPSPIGQTITGASIYDSQGNVLPPEQQTPPSEEQEGT